MPEAEAVPEIPRELGVSVEEARIIYGAELFEFAKCVVIGLKRKGH